MARLRKTRTEITIETETVVTWLAGAGPRQERCPECDAVRTMLAVGDAARIAGLHAREIYRLVDAGQLHALDTSDGNVLVCDASLRMLIATSGSKQ